MVPRIEISTPSRWEPPRIPWRRTSPNASPRRRRFAEVQQDDEEEDKSDADEIIDELESSASGESEGDEGVGWDERLKWWKVYAFHFLFMWNSNTIEYVSVSYVTIRGERTRADLIDLSSCFGVPR